MSIDRIDELARRVLKGDILLPQFQRGFVWNNRQIISLLDSIARGYPVGSMLLWQSSSQELRSQNLIADLDINLPKPGYPVNYLLDGQQRLSTICGALFWKPDFNPKSRWNIVYDLREQRFSHLDNLAAPPPHQIRVSKLSDSAAFFQHVASLSTLQDDDKTILSERANALFNRFKDYKIATVTLADLPVEDVAPIFERINSTGTALTLVDLMRAATWRPDFDLIDTIDAIREEAESKDFASVDRMVLLRNISTASDGEFFSESITQLRNLSTPALVHAANEVKKAFKLAVDFLSTEVGVQSYELVPYANQVTVLTEVYRRNPRPTGRQRQALIKWFWKTSLSGYFAGWSTGAMRADLSAVAEFSDGKAEAIPVYISPPSATIWKLRTFSLRNAPTKLLVLMLAISQPIDLLDGKKLDPAKALAWNNAKEFHHFFPRGYLRQKGVSLGLINCLANHIMISSASNKVISASPPSVYLRKLADEAGSKLQERLSSNLISAEAFDAAMQNDFQAFVDLRSKTLNDFVLGRTDWVTPGQDQTQDVVDEIDIENS